jgi:hypothetical protein
VAIGSVDVPLHGVASMRNASNLNFAFRNFERPSFQKDFDRGVVNVFAVGAAHFPIRDLAKSKRESSRRYLPVIFLKLFHPRFVDETVKLTRPGKSGGVTVKNVVVAFVHCFTIKTNRCA